MSTRPPKLELPPSEGETPYEVGYGKPPKETRFEAGVSGNPGGRPRGSRNKLAPSYDRLRSIILDEAYRNLTVNDGGRALDIPATRAAARTLTLNAAKGQIRAQQLLFSMINNLETADRLMSERYTAAVFEYKISWDKELARRKELGIVAGPQPVPHPDQIVVDLRAGTFRIEGPLTKEEVAEREAIWEDIRGIDKYVEQFRIEIDAEGKTERGDILAKAVELMRARRTKFVKAVGEPPAKAN